MRMRSMLRPVGFAVLSFLGVAQSAVLAQSGGDSSGSRLSSDKTDSRASLLPKAAGWTMTSQPNSPCGCRPANGTSSSARAIAIAGTSTWGSILQMERT
jgi:hypothetical protein